LLSGDIENIPEDEAVAVIYAQHWAESDVIPILKLLEKCNRPMESIKRKRSI
jgi:hypothetical protein